MTDVAHSGEKPVWEATGRGMSWGRVLHGALEAAMRDPKLDLALHAANLLAAEERPPGDLADVLRVVEGVRASPLWKRALAAKRRFAEVPFALPVAPSELGLADAPDATVLQGTIDLVFEEEGGWVLVDYKSDTVTPANRPALVAFYTPQIALLPALLGVADGPAHARGPLLPPHRRARHASGRLHASFTRLVRSFRP